MAKVTFDQSFDLATLLLGEFSEAAVVADASSVSYTLSGGRVLTLAGAFTLEGGLPAGGTITGINYALASVSRFSLSALSLPYAAFETAIGNDDLGALFSASDWMLGTAAADKLRGYAGDDLLEAGAGNDVVYASYGNDTLDGGSGIDTLLGGSGDDVFRVETLADRTVEYAGGGTDRVETALTAYTLGAQVENLTYTGTAAFTGVGNVLGNLIIGGKAADALSGLAGDDVLRGGNGNDTLNGGEGNDWLIGDAGAAFVTTSASRVSPSNPDVPISLSMTLPEVAASSTTTVSGYVNNATLGANRFNLAFILDVSGSMSATFSGASVGDRNGDGDPNSRLDAAIASFEALVSSIKASGLGDVVRIALIPFDSSSDIRAIGTGNSDANGNGVADVIDAARRLDEGTATSYDLGLSNAVDFFAASPQGDNVVFFISDGAPNGGPYDGFLDTLRADGGINATIRSIGVDSGSGGYYDVLDLLDDSLLNDSAIDVQDPAALTTGLVSSQVDLSDIDRLEIYRNGTLLTTLTPAQLTQTPFGLKYSYSITGLSATAADQIETRLVLADGQSSFLTTSQYVTVGALASNDSLVGGAGDDTLDGGAGVDTLVGGLGNDVFVVDSATDVIVEAANGGTDGIESSVSFSLNVPAKAQIENLTLLGSVNTSATGNAQANVIEGNIGNNTIQGLGGNDTLIGGFGTDTVVYSTATVAVDVNLQTGVATAGPKTDTLSGIENVRGSRHADTLTGDGGDNELAGLGGNDSISGGGGFDTVSYSTATSGVTVALNSAPAGGTATSANGAEGTDSVSGVEGVIGSGFADSISDGGNSTNVHNRFDGGGGADNLNGGDGSDTLIGGAGNDTLDGGTDVSTADIDVVDYSKSTSAISGRLAGTMSGSAIGTDSLSNFERLVATNLADSVIGALAAEAIEGGGGKDTLSGGGGDDTLDGGSGADRLDGGLGDDTFLVDASADVVVEAASQGLDTVISSASYTIADVDVERLTLTGTAALTGTGNAAANRITGNDGNNTLNGLGGADTIDAGLGDDTVLGGDGPDALDGGDGVDWLSFAGSSSPASGSLALGSFQTMSGSDTVAAFENLLGSSGDDNLAGDFYANDIVGGVGADTLAGDSGDDSLTGGSGNDSLAGGYGDDVLNGGAGDDSIDGGGGRDSVSYSHLTANGIDADLATGVVVGDGVDAIVVGSVEIIAGTGRDDVIAWKDLATYTFTDFLLTGGAGNDSLEGSAGDDTLDGGTGVDTMAGGSGADTYYVNSTLDVVAEGGGIDTIIASINYTLGADFENLTLTGLVATTGTGNAAHNRIEGNDSSNTLNGGLGGDTLIGGLGPDTLDGGLDTAADLFEFNSIAESNPATPDYILNFNAAHDTIDLDGIDANATDTSDYSSFVFIGTAEFSGVAGQLRVAASATDTFVYGDVDGDKIADFALQIAGVHVMTASEFYL